MSDNPANLSRESRRILNSDPTLCEDCPPVGYSTDNTRCGPCPRRAGLTSMQRLATASGNEPYADERICPTCGGRGHVSADPQPTASFEARRDAAAKAIYAVEEPEFGPDATDARGYPRWGNYYEHAESAIRAADRAATDALAATAAEAKGNGR